MGEVRALLTRILVLSLLAGPAASASSELETAKAEDAALRKSDAKLRLRHNILRVIDRWRAAVDAAKDEAGRREAVQGQAEAWALLAHWSGTAEDAERAQRQAQLAEQQCARNRLRAIVPSVETGVLELGIDAVRAVRIDTGTYGQHRMYFDLSPLIAVKSALGELKIDAEEVEQVRVVQLDGDTVRVVIDFVGAVADYTDRVELQPTAIRVRLKRIDARTLLSDIVSELKEAYPDVAVEPQKETPLVRTTREAAKPRARSLLAIRKVVIDAGHGGKDTGALGRDHVKEKDVNLAIAMKLGAELEKHGVKVVYTRTADRFVSLDRRARLANRAGADLFISVHANANRSRSVHGVETYYLDTSSNRYASRLARRENGQGGPPDLDPSEESEETGELPDGALGLDLRLILADLAMRSATVESKRLAGYVQAGMIGALRKKYDVKDLGVKHALFAVLLGVRMPSVLVETGFVTNTTESGRLEDGAYQVEVARAIAHGVRRFVDERERLAVAAR